MSSRCVIDGEQIVQDRRGPAAHERDALLEGELHGPFRRGNRTGAMGHLPREATPAVHDLAPDRVCEVLSPGTERTDRVRKMRIYAREGVTHVWLINPVAHTLEAYQREASRWVLLDTFEEADRARVEPFDAIELDLAVLWAG